MNWNNWLNELRDWISKFKWVEWVLDLIREDRKDEIKKLLNLNEELWKKFDDIFLNFYKKNKEKLDNYAIIFWDIFIFTSSTDQLINQKLIFALFLNNSVEDMSKNMWIFKCGFDFIQLITEYVNWENFEKHFWDFIEIAEFTWLEIYWEKWQEIVNKFFLAMKEKFVLKN